MKFRKKPVVIEAIQYTGTNTREITLWVDPQLPPHDMPAGWWMKQISPVVFHLIIPTLEGDHEARIGDWIIKGVAGEYYPCKPDIFTATYEPVGTQAK